MEKVYNYTVTNQEIFENIFKEDKLLMNHVVVPAGKIFPKHPTDAVVYVIVNKGELSISIEDNAPQTFQVGQVVNIPKGVISELGNKGNEVLELFVIKYDYDV